MNIAGLKLVKGIIKLVRRSYGKGKLVEEYVERLKKRKRFSLEEAYEIQYNIERGAILVKKGRGFGFIDREEFKRMDAEVLSKRRRKFLISEEEGKLKKREIKEIKKQYRRRVKRGGVREIERRRMGNVDIYSGTDEISAEEKKEIGKIVEVVDILSRRRRYILSTPLKNYSLDISIGEMQDLYDMRKSITKTLRDAGLQVYGDLLFGSDKSQRFLSEIRDILISNDVFLLLRRLLDRYREKKESERSVQRFNCRDVLRRYANLFFDGLIEAFSRGIQRVLNNLDYSGVSRYVMSTEALYRDMEYDYKLFVVNPNDSPFTNRNEGSAFVLNIYDSYAIFSLVDRNVVFSRRYDVYADVYEATPYEILSRYEEEHSYSSEIPHSNNPLMTQRGFFADRFRDFQNVTGIKGKQVPEEYLNPRGQKGVITVLQKRVLEEYYNYFMRRFSRNADFSNCLKVVYLHDPVRENYFITFSIREGR